MNRTLAYPMVALGLMLAGCSDDGGLTARGSVEASWADTRSGFAFPEDTRLDEAEASALGRITGTCELRRSDGPDGSEQYGIVVDVRRGSSAGLGLSSVTILANSGLPEAGRVQAEISGASYTHGSGVCTVDVEYVVADDGMVGFTGACDLQSADGERASVDVELDLVGCSVAE